MVKVIASSLRKGNVVEQDGNLHVILTAENVHPGKGNSVTNVNMRRMSDGVKVIGRWRTVEMVEKADVDEREYDYLYSDAEGHHFMEPVSYEQITVSDDIIGDQKAYLVDGMKVYLKTFEGNAIAMELPQRLTFEIVETEPVVKGQTASSPRSTTASRSWSRPISASAPASSSSPKTIRMWNVPRTDLRLRAGPRLSSSTTNQNGPRGARRHLSISISLAVSRQISSARSTGVPSASHLS
jgi:elongation factor P